LPFNLRALDQNGREAGVLSVGKGGAERKNYSAEEKAEELEGHFFRLFDYLSFY